MRRVLSGRQGERLVYSVKVKLRKQPERLRHLTDDLDNLGVVAMRLGYVAEWLSPGLRQQYEAARLRAGFTMPSMWSGGCGGCGAKTLAIENAEEETGDAAPTVTEKTPNKKRTASEAFWRTGERHICQAGPKRFGGFGADTSVSWSLPA